MTELSATIGLRGIEMDTPLYSVLPQEELNQLRDELDQYGENIVQEFLSENPNPLSTRSSFSYLSELEFIELAQRESSAARQRLKYRMAEMATLWLKVETEDAEFADALYIALAELDDLLIARMRDLRSQAGRDALKGDNS